MKINHSIVKIGLASVVLAALTGCTTYVVERPEPQAYIPPPPAPEPVAVVAPAPTPPPADSVVVIQSPDDFYQPLSAYGEWVVVDGYGRVWRPANVEVGWRPYANGHWELTDDGWYWQSDEPWGWATYHYGRWELSAGYGWVWVPQTQWAPAWVTWREGGGYVGWAPLPPERVGVSVTIAPATFCFVEERHIHDPVRPTTVIVNNTRVINKTVIINKTKIVNKVVVHDGPSATEVERVTGKKIEKVSVRDLRRNDEEKVVRRERDVQVHKETHVETGTPQRPDMHQEKPPRNSQTRDQRPAPRPEEISTPERKPLPREVAPGPKPVKPQPLPVAPPREERPAKNRERPAQETPQPTPITRQQNGEQPNRPGAVDQNRDRQPSRQPQKIQSPKQSERERTKAKPERQNHPAAKDQKNAREREANGTNTTDNANERR